MSGMMAVTLFMVIFSSSAMAEIYTWTDAGGGVHFTDTPPPDKKHQPVQVVAPVTLPMAENLQQHRRITGIRKQVRGILASDHKADSPDSSAGAKARARQEKTCAGYRRKLAQIQAQLRKGYDISKGNRLRRKRRELNRALSWECILR